MHNYKIAQCQPNDGAPNPQPAELAWALQPKTHLALCNLKDGLRALVSGQFRRLPVYIKGTDVLREDKGLREAAEYLMGAPFSGRRRNDDAELKASAALTLGLGKRAALSDSSALFWIRGLLNAPALNDAWVRASSLSVNLSFRLDEHPNVYRVDGAQSVLVVPIPETDDLLVQALVFTSPPLSPDIPAEQRPRRLVKFLATAPGDNLAATLGEESLMLATLADDLHTRLLQAFDCCMGPAMDPDAAKAAPADVESDWLRNINTPDSSVDMTAISRTIDTLADVLRIDASAVNFETVSRSTPSPQHLVAALRTSYMFRKKVRGWSDLLKFTQAYLNSVGLDSARLLKGLLP